MLGARVLRHLRRPAAVPDEGARRRPAAVAAGAPQRRARPARATAARTPTASPVDAGHRNYKDQWHKPELIFAITRFEGLAGFRDVDEVRRDARACSRCRWADEVAEPPRGGPPTRRCAPSSPRPSPSRAARWPACCATSATPPATPSARARPRGGLRHRSHRARATPPIGAEAARVFARVGDLVRAYPRDPGVLVTLLLNNVAARPRRGDVRQRRRRARLRSRASASRSWPPPTTCCARASPPSTWTSPSCSTSPTSPRSPRPAGTPPRRTRDFVPPRAAGRRVLPHRRPHPAAPRARHRPPHRAGARGQRRPSSPATGDDAVTARRGQSVFVTHDDGPLDLTGDGRVAIGSVPV